MIAGDGMNPIFWNVVIGHDLWQFAKRCGAVSWSAALTARSNSGTGSTTSWICPAESSYASSSGV